MKYSYSLLFLSLLFCMNMSAQRRTNHLAQAKRANVRFNFSTLENVYNTRNLKDAKTKLGFIEGFSLTDTATIDTLFGNCADMQLKAFTKAFRTNLELKFTDSVVYKSLFNQAKSKFKYSVTPKRVTGNRKTQIVYYTTSFSNYQVAKSGSITVVLITAKSRFTEGVVYYELHMYPYSED